MKDSLQTTLHNKNPSLKRSLTSSSAVASVCLSSLRGYLLLHLLIHHLFSLSPVFHRSHVAQDVCVCNAETMLSSKKERYSRKSQLFYCSYFLLSGSESCSRHNRHDMTCVFTCKSFLGSPPQRVTVRRSRGDREWKWKEGLLTTDEF